MPLPRHSLTTVTHLLVLLFPFPLLATDSCATLPPTTVTIKRLESPITTNFQYSYRTLRGLSADYNRQDQEILGLTRSRATVSFRSQSTLLTDPTGQWECTSHQIVVEYGFNPITVYVGKEFPPGTCAHKEIYEHELKHVRAYQEHARTIEAEIARALKQRFETGTPFRGSTGQTRQQLQQEFDDRWIPFIKRLLNDADIAQRKIDSPEEYQRVAASCEGSITRALSTR